MEAHRGLRRGYYCLRCTRETLRPEKLRYRCESILVCPRCSQSLYWGTWNEFLQAFAQQARESAFADVGRIVGKLLAHARN